MKKKDILFTLVVIFSLFAISYYYSNKTFQNDTFYTIKIGKSILKNGIDMRDHFSWIGGLDYCYPHYLYDLLIYFIYSIGGFHLIYSSTIVFGFIMLLLMYVFSKKITNNKYLSLILVYLLSFGIRIFFTARAQLVSTILLLIIIYLIEQLRDNYKKHYLLFLLILSFLTASIHAAVWPLVLVLFLPYIANDIIYLINKKYSFEFIKNYKIIIENSKIKNTIKGVISCLIAGVLVPNRNSAFTYFIKTKQGNSMEYITEHFPTTIEKRPEIFIVLLIFIIFLLNKKNKIKIKDLFMISGLFLLSLLSIRNTSLFMILSVISFSRIFKDIRTNEINFLMNKRITKTAIMLVSIFTIILIAINRGKIEYINTSKYPKEASDYIINNLDYKNIRLFNEYNYGSYLLYRDIPVFIDSRADLYMKEFNSHITVFDDCINIVDNYQETLEKYDITHIIVKNDSTFNQILKISNDYKEMYSDKYFTIYEVERKYLNE